ncbi:MAG TPA: thioredoxin-like domain-containing protein [Luteolibacter sp.]|nr:thioredoxin-like domain-containing protein [Luteolibacter sp.]
MKTQVVALLSLLCCGSLHAEFRDWTSADGKKASLELIAVKDIEGEKVGLFKMQNGNTVKIKASGLGADDAKALADWKPSMFKPGPTSVFDKSIDGNLVRLEGDKFVPVVSFDRPRKYYLFYYTASWCPPCRAFTPALVEWYEKNKNDNFELILITCDRAEDKMLGYAKEKKMPWPQVALDKVGAFRAKHQHGVSGIPALIACDLEGKNLGNFRSQLPQLTELVK